MDIGYWILRILPLFRGDSNTQVPDINYPAAKDLAEFVKFPMAKMNHAEKISQLSYWQFSCFDIVQVSNFDSWLDINL